MAGTHKEPTISDKEASWLAAPQRISPDFWQERMRSVLLPYLAKASIHIKECNGGKKGDRAEIMIQSHKKDQQKRALSQKKKKVFVV